MKQRVDDKTCRTCTCDLDAATAVVQAMRKKKAFDIKVLDMAGLIPYTEYFIIVSGATTRQVMAIAQAVLDTLAHLGIRPLHTEGPSESEWILIDCNSFIVHIFTPDRRDFFDLERLWVDAGEIVIPEEQEAVTDR